MTKIIFHFKIFPVFYCIDNNMLLIEHCFYRYFQAGGNPEQVIEQLSQNYSAVAQMANLLAEWLILGGGENFVLMMFIFKRSFCNTIEYEICNILYS